MEKSKSSYGILSSELFHSGVDLTRDTQMDFQTVLRSGWSQRSLTPIYSLRCDWPTQLPHKVLILLTFKFVCIQISSSPFAPLGGISASSFPEQHHYHYLSTQIKPLPSSLLDLSSISVMFSFSKYRLIQASLFSLPPSLTAVLSPSFLLTLIGVIVSSFPSSAHCHQVSPTPSFLQIPSLFQ